VNKVVVDTSALLAVINSEAGSKRVSELLDDEDTQVMVSAVNLSEAQAVLINRGIPGDEAWKSLATLDPEVIPFDTEQARLAGILIARTKKFGLSFGDRACLALGIREGSIVVTADQAWRKLKIEVEIEFIRG
jgi:PIN domain nuclease of toxin-antitoxin system